MNAALYAGARSIRVEPSRPVEPAAGEVRLRVAYCGICGTDVHVFHGTMDRRVAIPQPIGHEMSGTIEALGPGVSGFAVGEHVTVRPLDYAAAAPDWGREGAHIRPGVKFMGIDTPGAFQHSWTVPAVTLHRLPADLPLDVAALTEPLAVACHDVRIGQVAAGEHAVVLGGGPIGMLIALVARAAGAHVLVSEVNPFRLARLAEMGIDAVDPGATELVDAVQRRTGGIGADVIFEVTGTPAGAESMTKLPAVRGRIVVVGIFGEPPGVDLFQFFWKELRLFGARVYEHEDFEQAIALARSGDLPLAKLISKTVDLKGLQGAFEEIGRGADLVKVLVRCS